MRLASANASGPQAHQSTGLCLCCSRYGLVSCASRFWRAALPGEGEVMRIISFGWPRKCKDNRPMDAQLRLRHAVSLRQRGEHRRPLRRILVTANNILSLA